MSSAENLLQRLDELVTQVVGQWDMYTTLIAITIVTALVYQIATSREPDTHPMLLARQAQAAAVRNPGESAVYRNHASPHGMPLNSGLNVKDPGGSKWSRGKDGDLRDIWRKAVTKSADGDGKAPGERGHLYTVLGSEKVLEHDLGQSVFCVSDSNSDMQ